ncbi:class I SAM-dependent RNA methyltransferase [Oceanicaulis sp. MMSF_3324]|uniref:THUMP domain-containing class I SAM-dependent RNA methyltransferase n=1 Tax=Oceanicaulis sp. MMSF_3324 TaxID=3046702 RepID=UPI00273D01B2|nr:THUMP domain-containing protein [Oceanicaulis sp. MMSF_3324]
MAYEGAMTQDRFDIFLACPPGLETALASELAENGFAKCHPGQGGVTIKGGWAEVWRANLQIRGATRVLAVLDQFKCQHLNQLEQLARQTPWPDLFHAGTPVKVEASCRKSRIYHNGAAAERVANAIARTALVAIRDDAAITVRVRIDHDTVTLSVDTSGEPLHKRGYKPAVAKAPVRETLAALLLREMGYDGRAPLLDPLCGSGTFVIEAAQLAAGLAPGRLRGFAFERLANFDRDAFMALRSRPPHARSDAPCFGLDRDPGAVRMATENAERAEVADRVQFSEGVIKNLQRPDCAPGWVVANPPYGARIGDKSAVFGVYKTFGAVMRERFSGWRAAFITTDEKMAKATGLAFDHTSAPIDHGGLKIRLYVTGELR